MLMFKKKNKKEVFVSRVFQIFFVWTAFGTSIQIKDMSRNYHKFFHFNSPVSVVSRGSQPDNKDEENT